MALLLTLVFLAFGIIFTFVGSNSEQMLDEFCTKGKISGGIDLS